MNRKALSMRCWTVLLAVIAAAVVHAEPFRLATFQADITVPLGHALMGGGIAPAREVVDLLEARGVVLLGEKERAVFLALDWCELRNDAYEDWGDTLAAAAGTTRDRVFVACVHQHDAPVVDYRAQELLDEVGLPGALCDVAFAREALRRVASALERAMGQAIPCTHYGVGQAKIEGIASNRRVLLGDGRISYERGSTTRDAAMRAQPEGVIDPWLKTLSFWNGEVPLAAISIYATHPMSHYGQGGVSADFVGAARRQREAVVPAIFQVYFSGCSGDVTAGKFNDGDPANRAVLAARLQEGMRMAWDNTKRFPLGGMRVRSVPLTLEPKSSRGFSRDDMEHTLRNTQATRFERCLAALGLSWRERVAAGRPMQVQALDLGEAQFLLLPAESFVQYQLDAQKMRPDVFVLTAGYGECAPGYIPTSTASAEGFNDAHSWCWVAPGAEECMFKAMRVALGVEGP
jgi:hypothetical protein